MFNDQLLADFANSFYGYGSYDGDYWFVGMEEGGGDSFNAIQNRLNAWDIRGKNELEDLANYHRAIGISHFFDPPIKLQPTWNKLIRILFSMKSMAAINSGIKNYQSQNLGRQNGGTCLLELLPLPSPSTSKWLYAQYSGLQQLKSRNAYKNHYLDPRIMHLKARIAQYKPKKVVFYSFTYLQHWQKIANVPLTGVDIHGTSLSSPGAKADLYVGKNGQTDFAVIKHPAARGITNDYFLQVGKII